MKLKTRITLWITSLFVAGFAVSFLIQVKLKQDNLHQAEGRIHKQILLLEDVKRKHFEEFLGQHLQDIESNLKAQLYFFENNAAVFFRSLPVNDPYILPASWLLRNRWVSLIEMGQHTIVTERLLNPVDLYLEKSGLLIMDNDKQKFIAIPLTHDMGKSEKYYALFTVEQLENMQFDEPAVSFVSIFFDPVHPFPNWNIKHSRTLVDDVKHAQAVLKNQRSEKKRKIFRASKEHMSAAEVLKHWQYDQTNMIWSLTALRIGHSPFFPEGIVKVDEFGVRALFAKDVFCDKQVRSLGNEQENRLQIFIAPEKMRFFFGLKKTVNGQEVLLGIDAYSYLSQVAESIHETMALSFNGHLIAVFDENGRKIGSGPWQEMDLAKISAQSAGIVRVGNQDQFFLHMTPLTGSDLHFYAFIPKSRALAPIRMLDQETERLVDHLSHQMRFVALVVFGITLFIFLNIARKITSPITLLAGATEKISGGNLDEVKLPELKGVRKKDEVYSLYRGFQSMVDGLKEKERVRGVLNKVVAPEIAKEILAHDIHLGGEEREATILFGDIRHFTTTTEKMPPQEVISLLNGCMTTVSQVIDEEGGVIDKFVGDEVMALFGIPTFKEESTYHAVECAWKMLEAIKRWNEERKKEGKVEITMGIGIHKGTVVAGNMGAENRLNYTVVGANVNLAARLCGDAKEMQILMSDAVYNDPSVKEKIECDPVEDHQLKGFSSEVAAYSLKSIKTLS